MKYLLGIDQSTQGTKVVLVNEQGKIAKKVSKNHRQIISKLGYVSHDLNEIRDNIYFLVKKILKDTVVNPEDIVGLGITNQRETATAWSRKTGEPLSYAVVWQCSRAKQICSEIEKTGVSNKVYCKSGIPLSPYFTAAKFAWLLQNIDEVKKAAEVNDLCLGTVDSWLIYQLTNGDSFKTEPSNASRTQLMNIDTDQWDKELIDIFGIPVNALPQIVDSNSKFGMTDFNGILNHKIPIYGVLGDSQAALYGQRCTHVGDVKSTYGTGSSIMMNIGAEPVASKNGLMTSLAWQIDGKSTYVLEGNVNYSGAVVKWLRDDLGLFHNDSETVAMAEKANNEDKTYLVPAFTGLGAPYWNDNATGIIVGMTRNTRKNEIVRAGLQSIAYQINDVLQAMKNDVGNSCKVLKVDGGATANKYLMQFQCDLLQANIEIPNVEELSVLGSVFLAGLQIGVLNEESLKKSIQYDVFKPKMNKSKRQIQINGWRKAVSMINV